jgi:hypothetical protein
MESVKTLQNQNKVLAINNMELQNTVIHMEKTNENIQKTNINMMETEQKLKSDIGDLRIILSIMDTQNKTGDQIQEEMIRIVSNLKQQNDRHSRINKTHAFLIADKNKDGKISGSEMNILQNIFGTDEVKMMDTNSDNVITRDDFFKKSDN